MTKLVVNGPWIHSLEGVLEIVVREMTELRSLCLSDCGLDDSMLTGLSKEAAGELSRCLTYGLALFIPGSVPTPEAVSRAVTNNLAAYQRTDNYRGLSDLPRTYSFIPLVIELIRMMSYALYSISRRT
jgi:hypothetical protein